MIPNRERGIDPATGTGKRHQLAIKAAQVGQQRKGTASGHGDHFIIRALQSACVRADAQALPKSPGTLPKISRAR